MKRHGILNPHLPRVLPELGHDDPLVIADAGLPLPRDVAGVCTPYGNVILRRGVRGFNRDSR